VPSHADSNGYNDDELEGVSYQVNEVSSEASCQLLLAVSIDAAVKKVRVLHLPHRCNHGTTQIQQLVCANILLVLAVNTNGVLTEFAKLLKVYLPDDLSPVKLKITMVFDPVCKNKAN